MDTNALKKFAQAARNLLIDQVASKLDVVLAEGSAARREAPKAVKDLENAINKADKQHEERFEISDQRKAGGKAVHQAHGSLTKLPCGIATPATCAKNA